MANHSAVAIVHASALGNSLHQELASDLFQAVVFESDIVADALSLGLVAVSHRKLKELRELGVEVQVAVQAHCSDREIQNKSSAVKLKLEALLIAAPEFTLPTLVLDGDEILGSDAMVINAQVR
jgi:hypothetical protein